jgi:AcrR family transcriptional regulator
MARGAETKLRILDAAYALFWRQGFVRVSMDEIAQRAKLTKRTLYQHFRSKDELMASALARSSELALARLEAFRLPVGSEVMIDSLFGQLAEWASKPRWSGQALRGSSLSLLICAAIQPAPSPADIKCRSKCGSPLGSLKQGSHRPASGRAK